MNNTVIKEIDSKNVTLTLFTITNFPLRLWKCAEDESKLLTNSEIMGEQKLDTMQCFGGGKKC